MRYLLSFAALSILTLSVPALAEDIPAKSDTPPVAASMPAAPAATPSQPASTTAKTVMPAETAKPVMDELKDGTKVEFDADGTVKVINTDGSKVNAPDGVLTLKDETTFNVKDGKKVN